MFGMKELKTELSEIKTEIRSISEEISTLSEDMISISNQISTSMDKVSTVLHETNITIKESLELTSKAILKMTETFSESLKEALKNMQEMKIKIDTRDTVIKSLGLDNLLPDFFKKK